MVWFGLVVRDRGVKHEVAPVGPASSEGDCLRALFQALIAAGFTPLVTGQHDRGYGCLIEGRRGADRIVALAWDTDYTSQGCMEIHFERASLLGKSPQPAPRRALTIA